MRRAAALGAVIALLVPFAAAETDARTAETAHYRVEMDGTQAQADEAARVLEAAWPQLEAFFGAAPKLAKDEKLQVRYLRNAERFNAAIRAVGTAPPRAGGGYYWPPARTAFLYRQPTTYYSRVLLIHEAIHQFHFLARTKNRSPSTAWYTEGVAEHLSWHQWDGQKLRLAVHPPISLKDYAAAAQAEVAKPSFDLRLIIDGRISAGRALTWALFHYLATGNDGKPLAKFDAFRVKMDRGAQGPKTFRSTFGNIEKFQKRFVAWIEEHQQAWKQVFNEWESTGSKQMRGRAKVVSLCRLKKPTQQLSATLHHPERGWWRAGMTLHHTNNDDYSVALLSGYGSLRVDRRINGRWRRLFRTRGVAIGSDGTTKLTVERVEGGVRLLIGDQVFGPFDVAETGFGLAIDNCEANFSDIESR